MRTPALALLLALSCSSPPSADDAGAQQDASTVDAGETDAGTTDAGPADAGQPDSGTPDAGRPADAGTAADWIRANLTGAQTRTGTFMTRTTIETPAIVENATGCCSKYAFDVRETVAPVDPRAGFIDVRIMNLVSADAFGGGIQTSAAQNATLFLSRVTIEPNWPSWVDYATTNKDGLVLDNSAAIYGEDLTIRNWNADGAIDNKAPISQFVRLKIEGRGNRGIRYWGAGPHYLVDSTLQNTGGLGEGSIFWFSDCATAVVRIYNSTFNGSATVPADKVSCDNGSNPQLQYLTTDPRTTGEMHPMFKE